MAMVRGRVLAPAPAPMLPSKPDVIPTSAPGLGPGASLVPQQQMPGQLLTPSPMAFTGPVRIAVIIYMLILYFFIASKRL